MFYTYFHLTMETLLPICRFKLFNFLRFAVILSIQRLEFTRFLVILVGDPLAG